MAVETLQKAVMNAVLGCFPFCTCYYKYGGSSSPPPPSLKICNSRGGICCQRCLETCCDINCAHRYKGEYGFCYTLGIFS
ncbi:hypothetical protein CARUB_v10018536mg [Capsella rubella]|uniref:Defensin-like protein n=1 Tax=Capsella rubella TaxID=81985 RepID=R0HMP7_9BRAS|nr:hypothetical protein CARUB_v10018536mg [Capsella rubella]